MKKGTCRQKTQIFHAGDAIIPEVVRNEHLARLLETVFIPAL